MDQSFSHLIVNYPSDKGNNSYTYLFVVKKLKGNFPKNVYSCKLQNYYAIFEIISGKKNLCTLYFVESVDHGCIKFDIYS